MLETNIRAAYIHHFFPKKKRVSDRELLALLEKGADGQDPRQWHWALMDYGSYLKKLHPNPTRKSAHYHVQTKFKGSLREIRGEIIRLLTKGSYGDLALSQTLAFDESGMRMALRDLKKEGLIVAEKGSWRLA
jgi:A/G-specific adenine glycosylase